MEGQWYAGRPGRVSPAEPDAPTGINVGVGSAVVIVAALVAGALPGPDGGLRLGLLACALAGIAVATVDLAAVAFVTVLSCLVFDGFLVNDRGQLSWHGSPDIWRYAVLVGAALAGLAAGAAYRWVVRQRRFGPIEAWANGGHVEEFGSSVPDPECWPWC
jgi:hypothetical protein